MGNYILVKPVSEVETVINVIVASPEVAATYLVANGGAYDYVLDESLYPPPVNPGFIYDPENDSFTDPTPPEDFAAELLADLGALDDLLQDMLIKCESLDSSAIENAVAMLLANRDGELSANEPDLIAAVQTYLENGG